MDKDELIIIGARQNNLKNISLGIPHNKVTVITGLSGSGKSSLAFDTLFAEGQWRYIESLSTYARMFLEKVDRPDVDAIRNIRPAIAIEQKNPVRTSRSTVGTATEVSDYLRLLYAKVGRTICPACHREARSFHPSEAVEEIMGHHSGKKALILFPVSQDLLASLLRRGFRRVKIGEEIMSLEPGQHLETRGAQEIHVVLDRLVIVPQSRARLADSLEMAFREGQGCALVEILGEKMLTFRPGFRCPGCGKAFDPPQPLLFSFNHPIGACPECKGFGNVLRYDEDLVIPDKTLSLQQGAIEPWTKPSHRWWYRQLLTAAKKHTVNVNIPYSQLSEEEKKLLFEGTKEFEGINAFFAYLEGKRYKLHVRVFLSRYRSPAPCGSCSGTRLKPEALSVVIGSSSVGLSIYQACEMTIEKMALWLKDLSLSTSDREITHEVLRQVNRKISFLLQVGLGYLTLNRLTKTLSGGEAQRINLANQLGSQLAGTLYVLDEPSIGLHARDTGMLAQVTRDLAALGNTVVVVEHDRTLISSADHVVELGPGSGEKGGEVIFSGPFAEFVSNGSSLTARYLTGQETIPLIRQRRRISRGEERSGNGKRLVLTGARENNLKNIEVSFPLQSFICVTGVSGSGKSTLVHDTLYRALARAFKVEFSPMGKFGTIRGVEHLKGVKLIDQEPIGRTPRSNPVTYMKTFDEIRKIFAGEHSARRRGLTAGSFSFNTPGGRCETCQGNGFQKLEMYFFEDLYVTCQECEGKRYKQDVLTVEYQGRTISDVLGMTVEEAMTFFRRHPALSRKLHLLGQVGLGYLRLGQPATTLSGGEAQRLKICAELGGAPARDFLYILDEPTTGLHFADITRLLRVLDALVEKGNTVVVVEHHLDVIKNADWIIDLGPEAGEKGGEVVAQGPPETIMACPASHTGHYLKNLL